MSKYAWVTLATNDSYSLGALVLAHSLKRASTMHELAVLITPGVSETMQNKLKQTFHTVKEVNVMDSHDAAHLALLARPELGITFTKIHCWQLVNYEKCVFLDADTMVLQNCDELFEREELSAAPDVGWPDCFNSGVFVYRPNLDTFANLTKFALEKGSFDGGDQGLLNSFFSDWAHKDISKHLPFIYNTCSTATYSYLPAFKRFAHQVKILHFIGKLKPWLINFNSENKFAYVPEDLSHMGEFLQLWWQIFCDKVHPNLNEQMANQSTKCKDSKTKEILKISATHSKTTQSVVSQMHNSTHFSNCTSEGIEENFNSHTFADPWDAWYEGLEDKENKKIHERNAVDNKNKPIIPIETKESAIQCCKISSEDTNLESISKILEVNACDCSNRDQMSNTNRVEALSCQEICYDSQLGAYVSVPSKQSDNNLLGQEDLKDETLSDPLSSDAIDVVTTEKSSHANNTIIETINENTDRRIASIDCINEVKSGLAGALAKLKLGEPRTPEQEDYEQHMRRQCWESGNIDYTGRDSFDNIWRKISQTLESGPKPAVSTQTASEKPAKRLTSAKIEDGKVEYDKETNSTTVYKLIPGGYEMHITTPQPNGTNKTQTKTFYDPVPVTEEELLKQKKTEKNKKTDDNTTVTVKKVPGGHEEITTIINADGTKSIQTKTIYDAEEVEETETVETREQKTGQKNVNVKKQAQNKPQPQTKTLQKVDTEEQTSTHEFNIKSEKKVEETRRYSETTEIKGKSTKTTKKNTTENQNVLALEDTDSSSKKKKTKSPKKSQEVVEERVDENTTVIKTRVPGGTEYTYKKTLEDGTTEISTKTVYEQLNIEMTEEEIEEYEMQKKQAEKLKKTKKTKLPSEAGTKKIIPSENPGDVTTLETIQIEGGTEYHYTTVRADGTVKKSSKTVYDPVPVEGDEDEEEIIEEYEEEVIEPGEPITRTITTTKTLPPKDIDEKKLGQDAPVSKGKKKGIKSQ